MGNYHCFGEVLWDIFPDRKIAGGAPFNVAFHLHQLGAPVFVHSALGEDTLGQDLLELFRTKHLATDFLSINHLSTGQVLVDTSNPSEVQYTISQPSAWDNIADNIPSIDDKDTLVFGSLALRKEHNRKVLNSWLDTPVFKVLDLNLRAPFYNDELVLEVLSKVHLLKVNEEELQYVKELFEVTGDAEELFHLLNTRYQLEHLIVTRGSKGSSWLSTEGTLKSRTYSIKIIDTVGAGDAFLAALLYGLRNKLSPQITLDYAAGLGAFVAGKAGATPSFTKEELKTFISNQP